MHKRSFTDRFVTLFKALLPAPFTIAICLTVVAFACAWLFTGSDGLSRLAYFPVIVEYWYEGLWNNSLLVFAVQMMLMLVLGHVLALTKPVNRAIDNFTRNFCRDTKSAAFIVTLITVCVALFNWGLGLIFGAIFARKVGEYAAKTNMPLNYPLIGAAGYSGLMVWHGGFSGSALAKVAEPGHLRGLMEGIMTEQQIQALPESISYDQTVFGSMNIILSIVLIVVLPLTMRWLGSRSIAEKVELRTSSFSLETEDTRIEGAEKLDHSKIFGFLIGGAILAVAVFKALTDLNFYSLGFITPNWINLVLLGSGILLHGNFVSFLKGIDEAISGASGILIQFPLYFGIMGIMKSSGLVTDLSDFFVSVSNGTTYPIFTFFSAGLVNIFVPSGGGQWAVQGPIIIQAATELNVPLTKSILAMAYGDQLTNMLQPFWALPLLGITGLRAKEILPYTLFLMLAGMVIFVVGLLVF